MSAYQELLDLIADVETLYSPSHQPLMMRCFAEVAAEKKRRETARNWLQPVKECVEIMADRYDGHDDGEQEATTDALITMDYLIAQNVAPDETVIAVIATSQHYGGPEEGGWYWYRVMWKQVEVVAGAEAAAARAQELIDEYADQQPRYPITSAANTGQPSYEVMAVAELSDLPTEVVHPGEYS